MATQAHDIEVDDKWDSIPVYKLGKTPENLPGKEYRCIVAKRAIMAAYEDPWPEEAIIDLLADIRHLCDRLELDYGKLDDMAYGHYTEERRMATNETN